MVAKKNNGAMFRVKFWGVRGSYPTSDGATLAYGGHTSCVEVLAGGHRLIFDAGTGIIPLGKKLVNGGKRSQSLNLFLSHTHHDHVWGFYFFEPLFHSGARVCIFGPGSAGISLKSTLQAAMEPRFFPLELRDLKARKKFYSLQGGERIQLRKPGGLPRVDLRSEGASEETVSILVHRSPAHPNGVLLYRVCSQNKSIAYATDIEQRKGGNLDVINFIRGTDLLIHDAQYLSSEYSSRTSPHRGWGHSTVERAARVAHKAKVNRLILFHHDPTHDDRTVKQIEKKAQALFPDTIAAYEGMEIDLIKGS